MLLEFKKSLRNKSSIVFFLLFVISIIFVRLLVDPNLKGQTMGDVFSLYWNFKTQYGFIIFPITLNLIFNMEVNEKSKLFYKEMNVSFYKLHMYKLIYLVTLFAVLILFECVILFFTTPMGSMLLSYAFLEFMTMLQFIFIIGIISFIFNKNMIVFLVSVCYWVFTIIVAASTKIPWFAYFDQNTFLDERIAKLYDHGQQIFAQEGLNIIIYVCGLGLIYFIGLLLRGRFYENNKL